jgi:hypothetical protein
MPSPPGRKTNKPVNNQSKLPGREYFDLLSGFNRINISFLVLCRRDFHTSFPIRFYSILKFFTGSKSICFKCSISAEKYSSQWWHSNPRISATRLGAEHKKLGGFVLSNNLFCSSLHLMYFRYYFVILFIIR